MSYFSKRALRWAAPVALVGALGLAACGDNDDSVALRVAAPSAVGVGSDQHLSNKAEEIAQPERAYRAASVSVGSDQHLNNQAEQMQLAQAARLAAQAEQFERSAHLEGQANTYSGTDVPTNSDANLPNAFEAGNRAAQKALAEG